MQPIINKSNDLALPSIWPTYFKLILVALLWGGTFIAGRLLAGSLSPLMSAIGRFGLAVLILILLTIKLEGRLPKLSLRQVAITFALGLTGIFTYNLCFFTALSEMPASRTALFVAFNPIATALLVSLLYREKISFKKLLGISVAVLGALTVISNGHLLTVTQDISQAFGRGELSMLCAVLSWAIYTVVGRKALLGLSPLVSTTYAAIWGLLLLLMVWFFNPNVQVLPELNWKIGVAIGYLAVFGTVIPFIWYYQGIKTIGAAQTSVFTNFVPLFGVLLGALLLNEQISSSMLLGTVLVITGVVLTNRR
ncbi:DMT family transporter [Psychromonas antarctica]|uniref:DMT family transporter n=1 Tax=Psychromonas antarctica TaxID=67573 RepID=UPI001EE7DE16|nr:DMT family transporter [Psychromonas antarctica]MCG6202828.1 DMT family transporter [Psychromonas antarctica]